MKYKVINSIIKFDKIVGITSLFVAFVAAFFSIYGISTLFSGAFYSAAIMASSLEIAKLVSVSFLYRYWIKTPKFIKAYLSVACLVLMFITSLGIFGYLSAAYTKSSSEINKTNNQVKSLEYQRKMTDDAILQSKSRIELLQKSKSLHESRLSEAITNTYLSRNPIQLKQLQEQTIELVNQSESEIKSELSKIKDEQGKLVNIDNQITDFQFNGTNKDIQTFKFVADMIGISLDSTARIFIFLLVIVFDPLAVSLVLAYNVITYKGYNIREKELLPEVDGDMTNVPLLPNSGSVIVESAKPEVVEDVPKSDNWFNLYFKR